MLKSLKEENFDFYALNEFIKEFNLKTTARELSERIGAAVKPAVDRDVVVSALVECTTCEGKLDYICFDQRCRAITSESTFAFIVIMPFIYGLSHDYGEQIIYSEIISNTNPGDKQP